MVLLAVFRVWLSTLWFYLLEVSINSPGFCPVACQITSIEFCYQPFPFFRILFETFAIEANSISNCFRNFCNRIEANSSSHFDSISNSKQLKLGHKFEPQLELELKSNTNSNHNSSSSWNRIELNRAEIESNLILFEKCAREAVAFIKNNKRRPLWEPLDMCMITRFHLGGPLFWSDFWKGFFLKNGVKWSPKWPQKGHEIWQKTNLKRSPQKMLKMC